jgi:hypothetical protein
MRLQLTSPKDEPSVKAYAVFYPLLLLVIIPFALALVLPSIFPPLFPYFQIYNPFSPELYAPLEGKTPDQLTSYVTSIVIVVFVSSFIISVPGLTFILIYGYRYGVLGIKRLNLEEKFMNRKYSRIQINLHEVLNRILLAAIITLVATFILLYLISGSERSDKQLLEKQFYFIQIMSFMTMYLIFLYLISFYLRRDFRFIMAKKCVDVANEEMDKAEKINYLVAGLSWYNKYLNV